VSAQVKAHAEYNEGKRARLIQENVEGLLQEQEMEILMKLKHLFGSGDTDAVKYISAAAQLCGIDDLRAKLSAKINRGNKAAKEIVGGPANER
jgi:hypothetical protein